MMIVRETMMLMMLIMMLWIKMNEMKKKCITATTTKQRQKCMNSKIRVTGKKQYIQKELDTGKRKIMVVIII